MLFDAIEFAARAHRGQFRKIVRVPYIYHPLSVARTLIEQGSPDAVVVAAVLHDTVEDTDATLEEIRARFGSEVARLVEGASEPEKEAPWEARKRHTVAYLERAPQEVLLLICADKLDNIRAMRADWEREGDLLWGRFSRPRPFQKWYYHSIAAVMQRRAREGPLLRLTEQLVAEAWHLFGPPPAPGEVPTVLRGEEGLHEQSRVDHVVIRVRELHEAMGDFERLGFTVVPGGEHEAFGSHNALIGLADGSYLELIAFPGSPPAGSDSAVARSAPGRRLLAWGEEGEGLVDWALVPAEVGAAIDRARAGGVPVEGPIPGGRLRPDGLRVEWQFGIPDRFDLPFFCADVTPRERRVPQGASQVHANGAQGIHALVVAVADPDRSVARYRALLGEPVALPDGPLDTLPALPTVAFGAGSAMILLARAEAGAREGPVALLLRSDTPQSHSPLDPDLSHGALITLVEARKGPG